MKHVLALALGFGLAWPTSISAQTITEFPVPTSNSQPAGITAGPDGALWFTEFQSNKIGQITTVGAITEFLIPQSSSGTTCPYRITADPDGTLWFTESCGNYGQSMNIGQITTSGSITEYSIPSTSSYPDGITIGPDGALWFAEYSRGKIGRITISGSIAEFSGPTSTPTEITTGPDGALWFTEFYNPAKIGRITTSGSITEYPLPSPYSEPRAITTGPDGALWFTEEGINKIGRITTSGSITEYPFSANPLYPRGITVGPDNALWITAYNGIGRMLTSGSVTDFYTCPTFCNPDAITTGPDGALWFTDGVNNIGRITVPGLTLSHFPLHDPTGQEYTPYTVPIISVFDHSPPMYKPAYQYEPSPLYACNETTSTGQIVSGEVLAFTGDTGGYPQDGTWGTWGKYQGDTSCFDLLGGVYHGHQLAYGMCPNAACKFPSTIIKNYVGANGAGGPYYLNYEGHPGYDYRAQHSNTNGELVSINTPVYAAAAGTVSYPSQAVGMNPRTFHALALAPDANLDYRIYYLHLLTHPDSAPISFNAKEGCYTDGNGNPILPLPTTLPLPTGTHAESGCEIARSGDAGVPGSPHLHFEVQQRVSAADANPDLAQLYCLDRTWVPDSTDMCVPVDPYGWAGAATDCTASPPVGDKYACLTGVFSTLLWAPPAASPNVALHSPR